MEKLMKNTKKELCKKIIEYEDAYDEIKDLLETLVKENDGLKKEAERDGLEYYELLKYKNQIRDKYMRELPDNKKVEKQPINAVSDLGGNIIKVNK